MENKLIEKNERNVFYSIWNDYVGNLELGYYRGEKGNNLGGVQKVFFSLSDAMIKLFEYIKEDLSGEYSFIKENPKSKFTIEQIDTSKKPMKRQEVYEKAVYTITAKEILDLHKINRLEKGGNINNFNYTIGGL